MFQATLAGIFKYKELPEKYGPFVEYKASLEDKSLQDEDDVAILDIVGTESVHVLLISSYQDIKEIEAELEKAEANLNHRSKQILEGYL